MNYSPVTRMNVDPARANLLTSAMAAASRSIRGTPMRDAISHDQPNIGARDYAREMMRAPTGFGPQDQPGASRARRVMQAEAGMPIDVSVFGQPLAGVGGLLGLAAAGSGCTSTGATAAAAVLGAGSAIGANYASGTLGTNVQAASSAQVTTTVGATTTTPTPSTTLTAGQKAGLATSIIGTLGTAIWGAVCSARGSENVITASSIGAGTTNATVAAIQAARTGATVATTTGTAATTTTPTTTTENIQVTTRDDDKKMLYIGGGVVLLGLLGVILLKD